MPLVLRVAVVALCNAALSAPKQATARSLMRCKVPQPLPINTQAAGRIAGLLTHASTDTYVWCKTYQQPTGFRNFTALRAKPRSWQLLQVLQMPFSQHIHLHNPWHNPKPATATAVRRSRITPPPSRGDSGANAKSPTSLSAAGLSTQSKSYELRII